MLDDSNLIVILVDTLRADHLGSYGHQQPTSPYLDRLAKDSIVFDRVVAPASQTVPSMLSLWSGLYPSRHGNQYFAGLRAFRVPVAKTKPRVPEHVTLLSETLGERGYKTGAIVTNPWLRKEYGFARGFDVYQQSTTKPPFPRGPEVNRSATELMERWKNTRFFLYVHYMDAHIPYETEPRYRDLFPEEPGARKGIAQLRSGYNAEIRAVDDYVGELLATAGRLGLTDNTLVVFVSDHGEEFGEHGGVGHGHALYQELVRVPLLLHHPKLRPFSRRIDTPVSLVDFRATVLELLTGMPGEDVDGISLVPEIRGTPDQKPARILYSELGEATAALRGDKKVIRSRAKKGAAELAFDLSADPDEKNPIAAPHDWVRQLSNAIQRQEAQRFVDTAETEPIDPATEERVRALGY